MKKYLVIAFSILFLCINLIQMPQKTMAISAQSYCVIDKLTGRILYEKSSGLKHGMASTTKIMTAIVALENAAPDSIATVSYNASRTEGSSLYLKPGEKMSVIDLVYGLMLNSGNDAAVVLAEHIGGSVENFALMMNELAQKIGANLTHFTNPNGLYDDMHYTTAYDFALITRYALNNEVFGQIASTKKHTIQTIGNERKIYLSNHNKLLNTLDGCDGVKTGYTKKTGRCLVSSVSRDGWQAICVTINASDDWNDHKTLINKAFSEYSPNKIISKGQYIKTISVSDGVSDSVGAIATQDVFVAVKENENFDYEIVYKLCDELNAPVEKNQYIGCIDIMYKGNVFASVNVAANDSVERTKKANFIDYLLFVLKSFM